MTGPYMGSTGDQFAGADPSELERLQAEIEQLTKERDAAIGERDEMRRAAPDADVAYWQDRCLDHATALDAERPRRKQAEARVDQLEQALGECKQSVGYAMRLKIDRLLHPDQRGGDQ